MHTCTMSKTDPTRRFAFALALLVLASTEAIASSQRVSFDGGYAPGTIVVDTSDRRLYFVEPGGQALRYPVGVGRSDRKWQGVSSIKAKFLEPNWSPPAAIRADTPSLPAIIAGGSPQNPMGAAAMTLEGTDYAIHGTNNPASIGGFVSYGCIRMLNADVLELFAQVRVGTTVVVRP